MTADIARLADDAVERIAAGEVVTGPDAVVKELVENALDAGAGRVEIAVENAGIDRIRVADDGEGMTGADARMAFERHATSKIRTASDVEGVATLGFRGEALAAIAEAGDAELTTRSPGGDGIRVTPDGETTPAARGVGTTVEVRDLFADRPARRSSLASPAREFAKVSDLVSSYALLYPGVRFSLDHAESRTFDTPGTGDRSDALLGVYDRSVAGQATEFAHRDGPIAVEGVACYPSVTRSKADHVHAAVDGRVVEDSTVRGAVVAGYGSLVSDGRYPVAAVDVSVPPARVDVNVHPAKSEVAFADAAEVERVVARGVEEALSTGDRERAGEVATDLDSSLESVDPDGESTFTDLSVLGVFRDLYVLCEDGDRMLVVDAHAAHERVNYERLRAAVEGGPVPSRTVDPPETLALTPGEAALLVDGESRAAIERVGFEVSLRDDDTCRVRAVPAPQGRTADPDTLRDVLDELRSGGDPEAAMEDPLADLACHPSLKAGDGIDRETARRLVERLGECERPYACPHGRPTLVSIEEASLARGFDRPNTRLE